MHKISGGWCLALSLLLGALSGGAWAAERPLLIPKWERFERSFESRKTYENPFQEVKMGALFLSPSGQRHTVMGFWDGGNTWKVRFSPNEPGRWRYTTGCTDTNNTGLAQVSGEFHCTAPRARHRFSKHGPVAVSKDGRFLMHEDGTPFFWLADTTWNGPLKSSPKEWEHYIDVRRSQQFNAVQWVTTQWRAAPNGNRLGQKAYTGREVIRVNPHFFQHLDEKVEALNEAGLLNVPVLLWAHPGNIEPRNSPGHELPESEAILLAQYMVARWGANDVVWMLGGDGDYRGEKAAKWVRIGRAVFGEKAHAPVIMHPQGRHWVLEEFGQEPWFDIMGYQSGHGTHEALLRWLASGPPASDWRKQPHRPFINLEPPYEFHIGSQKGERLSATDIRRAVYWSLLFAPTAGVSYGGHGVWGWDDGSKPPVDHPNSGTPLPLRKALEMPGAEQMGYVWRLFGNLSWWRLRPAPDLLASQPGEKAPARYIAVSRTVEGDEIVAYTPEDRRVELKSAALPEVYDGYWYNPRNADRYEAVPQAEESTTRFTTPAEGDWVLVLRTAF